MNVALTARRSATRPVGLAAAALRALGGLGIVALVGFHAWLLAVDLFEGRAFEPGTAARWGLAVLALWGFRALSRRGLPLFSGRRAVVLWLLVVVIHCSAGWDGSAAAFARAIPESVAALAPVSFAVAALGVVLLAVFTSAARPWAGGRPPFAVPLVVAGLPSSGVVFSFSPRPPPLA